MILDDYDDINFGILHHIKISLNSTLLQVWITGGGKQDYYRPFPRNPTQEKYINVSVPIWFMSDCFYPSTPFNIGSATFSNIIIKSSLFCIGSCAEMPTISPTVNPTQIATISPTVKPTISPTSQQQPHINPPQTNRLHMNRLHLYPLQSLLKYLLIIQPLILTFITNTNKLINTDNLKYEMLMSNLI